MDNRTHEGLDVHKETTAVAELRLGTWEPDHRVVPTTPEAYRKLIKGNVVFCYEAGPCGFDPYRMLHALGADYDVIAPTLIPRRAGHNRGPLAAAHGSVVMDAHSVLVRPEWQVTRVALVVVRRAPQSGGSLPSWRLRSGSSSPTCGALP